MTLFGFNILEEWDPIAMDTLLRENEWKSIWMCSYDRWSPEGGSPPNADILSWLQNVPATPPFVTKISNGDEHRSGTIKIWIRPDDYVLFVLKFS